MRLHLTDMTVRNLKATERSLTYWDDTTPGFGIRVGKNRKTWTIMRGANRQRMTIGHYGEGGLSLSEARAQAKRLLAETPEQNVVVRITFKEARPAFIADNYREAKLRTGKEANRLLEKHFKTLHARMLSSITDLDIARELQAIVRPHEKLHAFRVIRCFFRWCMRPPRKWLKHNPMEGYQAPGRDRRRTRILTDSELVAVWRACDSAPYSIFRLLILWGTRNSETACIRRDWISDGVLTIPGGWTKNGRPHEIPILPLAREVLDSLPQRGQFFFTARWDNNGHMSSGAWSKLRREIQAESGTRDWQIRDIRRTFRSSMARLRVPRDLCEVLINHAPPVLDEIYDRYDRLEEKRHALEKLETFLTDLLSKQKVYQQINAGKPAPAGAEHGIAEPDFA